MTPEILTSCYKHGQHIAVTMPFDDLYNGLMQEAAKNYVRVIEYGDLRIFTYTQDCQFGNNWNEFSLISRGLILDVVEKRIVALTFPKFFNFGETCYFLPEEKFTITEKQDGSLGIVYYHRNKWHVATRGSFTSEQSRWAENWLHKNANTIVMNPNCTYLAEIIYHSNKIVIPYDFEGLVLLSVYDLTNGHELPYEAVQSLARYSSLRVTERHEYDSIDELLTLAETLPSTREGFVVRFDSGYRMKIKGDEYCRVHRLISNVKPIYIWECLMNGDDIKEIRKQLPEELRKDFDNITTILQDKFDIFIGKIEKEHEKTKDLSDKELGLLLKSLKGEIDETIRSTLFLVRKKDLLVESKVGGSSMRKRVFNMFKPKANKLAGYVPTSAMNRFDEQEN